MYMFLMIINFISIPAAFVFLVRSVYKTFIDERAFKLGLFIILCVASGIYMIRVVDLCLLADGDIDTFVYRGYSLNYVIIRQAAAIIIFLFAYLFKRITDRKIQNQYKAKQNDYQSKQWSKTAENKDE